MRIIGRFLFTTKRHMARTLCVIHKTYYTFLSKSRQWGSSVWHTIWDSMTWERFPRCWPFVKGIRSWIPLTMGQQCGGFMFYVKINKRPFVISIFVPQYIHKKQPNATNSSYISAKGLSLIILLRPKQNNFPTALRRAIFWVKVILLWFTVVFLPYGQLMKSQCLFQEMAWHRTCDTPLPKPTSPMLYDVTTVYPKKYAHGFCFAVLCCGYTLTDFPISIRLTSLALWQSNDCPSASKATLMKMDKYFMLIHYERLHNHNKAKHNKTVCIFPGIYCRSQYNLWTMLG